MVQACRYAQTCVRLRVVGPGNTGCVTRRVCVYQGATSLGVASTSWLDAMPTDLHMDAAPIAKDATRDATSEPVPKNHSIVA